MTNLLLNAIDAYEGKEINKKNRTIVVDLQESQEEVILSVKDEGVGILKEHMQRIFLPFFTTKSTEKGTGIGLSISQEIVEKSFGGTIGVSSSKSDGTIFTVMFPLIKNKKEINENLALVPSN